LHRLASKMTLSKIALGGLCLAFFLFPFVLLPVEHSISTAAEQPIDPLFRLPFNDPPGPDTWLLAQPYGNTLRAYEKRASLYRAGQGMHFGVDFASRCGYPVYAIGDGVVAKVSAPEHGSRPHNVMIDHANGYASFYGHLLERSHLAIGQWVSRGDLVGLIGDPDGPCTARPHLHLEIRNAGVYNQAYNPMLFIAADWDTLALVGPYAMGFARDQDNPHLWQRLDEQPTVNFQGRRLNDYPNPIISNLESLRWDPHSVIR
jgi:hypothetical protein